MLVECHIEDGKHIHSSHNLADKWYCAIYVPYPCDTYVPHYLQLNGKFGLSAHWFDTKEEIRAILLKIPADFQLTEKALIDRNNAYNADKRGVFNADNYLVYG
ncbi:MAG: hypothetical protein WDA42_06090 [Candidatus Bathyarchaeia archaeon]|jgi:hypothetical protein